MKTVHALLIAALFTTAACKKKDEAAKMDPAKDPAAKTAEPSKADPTTPTTATPTTPDPAKAEPAKGDTGAANVTVDQAGAKVMELTDKIVKASTDAGDDCAKFGTGLKGLTEEAKTMAAYDKELGKDPAKKQELQDKYEKPAQAKIEPLMAKLEKCAENPDVKAFLDILASE